jgi:RimJ/RimL family protein N-acetyltransferase
MSLRRAEIGFRPLIEADLEMFRDWLLRPHVKQWWGDDEATRSLAALHAHYSPRWQAESKVSCYIAELNGQALGFIQNYVVMGSGDGWWEDETDLGARGTDQFLAHAEQLGQGLGTHMVQTFVRRLFADPAVSKVQTDPHPSNARAIACYRKCGFEAVGEVITPDGPALLMVQHRNP